MTIRAADFMQADNDYDAIIIGAGPAGATAAYLMAKGGLSVLILDKKEFPRPKLCGGLITWKTVRLLKKIFDCDTETLRVAGAVIHESDRYAVCSDNHQSVEGKLKFPFHFVDRERYDNLWLERAREAGAKLIAPAKVKTVDIQSKSVKTTEGTRYQGRYIIGADGALSRTKKALVGGGFIRERTRAGLAQAIEVKVPVEVAAALPHYPKIYYGHVSRGYAWSFPGPGCHLLGIAGLKGRNSSSIKVAFNRFLTSLSLSLPPGVEMNAAPLPYGNFLKTPGWGDILLVGDAGGIVDPLLGEGIYHAHRSAQLAAESIIFCHRNGRRGEALKDYTAALARRIIPDLRYARAGRNLVYSLPQNWYYPVLTAFLRIIRHACEETIQGRRTYLWFRKVSGEKSDQ
jgi:geranylgeranyl reductase family protein